MTTPPSPLAGLIAELEALRNEPRYASPFNTEIHKMTCDEAIAVVREYQAAQTLNTSSERVQNTYGIEHVASREMRSLFDPNIHCDGQRVIDWMDDPDRKRASMAFTEGLERQIAYRFEDAATKPVSLVVGAKAIQGVKTSAANWTHDQAKACAEAWGLKYVD